ncbi:GNAT family N-acetyltransferase [uncultured Vibrio sp.]|uniref:GNAT family N-acetyltransferase n=1 Tax=uncultured Vibrio sp. TaxID=114054 RepID=UPI00260E59B2|nr:GNAT family N-acetyltransferase [uncultured Vibrio sp.]
MSKLEMRNASADDSQTILRFINELAEYENAQSEVKASINDIEFSLFSEEATASALICEYNGEPIGFAVYFYNYSTWLGKRGLYLEDLYVSPEYRGIGAGKVILKHLARLAVKNQCGRFEWCVLDWNEPAIEFYNSIGAKPQDEWTIYRLAGDELEQFAE